MSEQAKRICILGGGFGGLYTALRLSSLPWENSVKPEIVLVDRHDRFLFSPLLYELVSEEMQTWEIAPPFAEILADTSVKFIRADVIGIDVENQRVRLENHPDLHYDVLTIATGAKAPMDIVPGAAQYAIPYRTLDDAYRLKERLRELENSDKDKIRIAIVGGGYNGVELACKLADRLGERGRLRLIERGDTLLKTSPEFNRQTGKTALELRRVWLDLETEIESIGPETVSLIYKGVVDVIPADLVLWTVGTAVSELIKALPLKHGKRGLLVTNSFLQMVDRPEIFAIGDVAECKDASSQQVPPNAQVAIQQSDYCAWNIWAHLTGRPLLPFRYLPLGEILTLGLDGASISSLGFKLDGYLAYVMRRLVYLYRMPTLQHQLAVGLNWIATPVLKLISR